MSTRTSTTKAPSKSKDEIEFEDVADVAYDRSFGFYGRAGSGKTTLAGTFPKPLLLIDINDNGTDSVSDVKDIKVIRVRSWQKLEDIYWDMKENPPKYAMFKTVVIDTVTQMQTLCLEEVMKRKGKSVADAGKWGSMTKAEWGTASQQMKEWITNYSDLPVNTVFIAQDREDTPDDDADDDERRDEGDIMPEIGPSLMKSVAKSLGAAVHVLGYSFVRQKPPKADGVKEKDKYQYCLRIGPHPIYSTKVRKPKRFKVPSLIIDPTYDDVLEIVRGEE